VGEKTATVWIQEAGKMIDKEAAELKVLPA
jgi:hypothetical protein